MERPRYHCKFPGCAKAFKRKDYLSRHRLNHEKTRLFSCKPCGAFFARRDLLKKHERSKSHLNVIIKKQGISIFLNTYQDKNQHNSTELYQNQESKPGTPSISSSWGLGKFKNFRHEFEESLDWLFGTDSSEGSISPANLLEAHDLTMNTINKSTETDCNQTNIHFFTVSGRLAEMLHKIKVSPECITYFSPGNLFAFLNQYWACFDSIYPIIHKFTFEMVLKSSSSSSSDIDILILISIISTGAMFSNSESHHFLFEVQSKVRISLIQELQNYQDIKQIPIQLLQCLALNDHFNLHYGTDLQHVDFQIYHPMIINLVKEKGMLIGVNDPLESKTISELDEVSYQEWIEYETVKRLALFVYIVDVQRAFFSGKEPCISLFEVQLNLPCTDCMWYSNGMEDFKIQYAKQPRDMKERNRWSSTFKDVETRYEQSQDVLKDNLIPNVHEEGSWPNFLWSIRRLMQPYSNDQIEYHVDCFSQFSRLILLHGVLSLVRDVRKNHLFDISTTNKFNSIAAKIEHSFYSWRIYLHSSIAASNSSYVSSTKLDHPSPDELNNYDISPAFWTNITMFNIGLLGLYCNFDHLIRQFKILEAATDGDEAIPSKFSVILWSTSKDGEHSFKQACTLLRIILTNRGSISVVPYLTFAVYISVIVCWIYERSSVGSNAKEELGLITNDLGVLEHRSSLYLDIAIDDTSALIRPSADNDTDRVFLLKHLIKVCSQYLGSYVNKDTCSRSYLKELDRLHEV